MELKNCNLCNERRHAKQPVAGIGELTSEIILIGRNPGRVEDKEGKPYQGTSGKKLNYGLLKAGIKRDQCFVTNVSKCYTPSGMVPSRKCQHTCSRAWLANELLVLETTAPCLKLIIAFGNEALQCFEPEARIGEIHGELFKTDRWWHNKTQRKELGKIYIFSTYHPAAASRNKTINLKFMADMLQLAVVKLQ